MTTTPTSPAPERASGSRMGAAAPLPRAGGRSGGAGGAGGNGVAPVRGSAALLQTVLFWAGAILMPLGIVVILLGYYGVANSVYDYEREAYQVSGGFLGLGLTFLGGFLYFGAWLAKIAADNNAASRRLADTLLVLADVTSKAAATMDPVGDVDSLPVTAGDGATLHRRDCSLIAHRDDLHPAGARTGLQACRVCRPAV
ncbi:hypothetical protein [Nocardioides litoris]|uniref:hypothetical protein n=1 Tax=Nocardioides litoris TaxID=1926648 RepID=UPI00111F9BEB|nr:hypothetical protein [Nocardioides litoris]